MSFKVAARAVLELGAELISSDEIAIYELVKNAFDAGSETVEVIFKVRLKRTDYEAAAAAFEEPVYEDEEGFERTPSRTERNDAEVAFTVARAAIALRLRNANLKRTARLIGEAATRRQAREVLRAAYDRLSTITIRDTGEGMSLATLRGAFLTIGTPNRLRQRKQKRRLRTPGGRTLLGEKGIGRLSAMRLGSQLSVLTGTADGRRWSRLIIDWTKFALDDETLLEQVPVRLFEGEEKSSGVSGTTLVIWGLESEWTKEKLERIAAREFSRISDPFVPLSRTFPIKLSFNGEAIRLRRLASELFKHAHGICSGHLRMHEGQTMFHADFEYKLYGETTTFDKGPDELRDAVTAAVPQSTLRTLGPVEFKFYWFNRQLLKAIDGIGTVTEVRALVNSWSGGLMIFRDGFRVNPYGGPGDDWLELDRQAFQSSGYLLNSDQIIGRIQIGTDANPRLVDQTNREGLRDNFEFQALKHLLRHFITVDLKHYIDRINDEYSGLKTIDFRIVDRNVDAYEKRVEDNLAALKKVFPGEDDTLVRLRESFRSMRFAYNQARDTAQRSETQIQRLTDLAGIGLLVEVVGHELARATKYTLELITRAKSRIRDESLARTFASVEGQLVTIERRLRVLDPLSVSGRQRRTSFDLVEAIRDVFAGRSEECVRAGVKWTVTAEHRVQVKAVKGMIYQIIENLVSNSLHWLARGKEGRPDMQPTITVTVSDAHDGSFRYSDNGPGISIKIAREVFDAFFTTRGEEGRGLGLYIARINARYNGGDLRLVAPSSVHPERFNTFEFRIKSDDND